MPQSGQVPMWVMVAVIVGVVRVGRDIRGLTPNRIVGYPYVMMMFENTKLQATFDNAHAMLNQATNDAITMLFDIIGATIGQRPATITIEAWDAPSESCFRPTDITWPNGTGPSIDETLDALAATEPDEYDREPLPGDEWWDETYWNGNMHAMGSLIFQHCCRNSNSRGYATLTDPALQPAST